MSTGVPSETRDAAPRLHPSRRALVKGAAWAAPVAAMSVAAPAYALSVSCTTDATFNSQARGRLLSGGILGADLDAIAAVEGVHARAFLPAAPGASDGSVSDEKSSPLSVSALGAIEVDLGGTATALTNLLAIVAGQDTGLLNQYAFAHEGVSTPDQDEIGASGTVSDNSGAINLEHQDPGAPELGTLDLYSILQQATGDGVADLVSAVSDLQLQIGAAAGRARLAMLCDTSADRLEEDVERDYLLAYLRLLIETEVAGSLISAISQGLDDTEITISEDALLDALSGIPILGPILSGVGSALAQTSVTVTINTAQLTEQSIPDEADAALAVHPSDGTITLDLASLLGSAYPGTPTEFLNSLSPNTRLFVDAGLPSGGVTAVLDQWVTALVDRLASLATVNVSVTVANLVRITVNGTLAQLLAGEGSASVETWNLIRLRWEPLAGVDLGLVLTTVGGLVRTAIEALFDSETGALRSTLDGLNGLLSDLFAVLSGVLAITVNAQNDASGTVPSYYQAITPEGRYDVAALHLELIGALNLLNLSIARGSVGENTLR